MCQKKTAFLVNRPHLRLQFSQTTVLESIATSLYWGKGGMKKFRWETDNAAITKFLNNIFV